MGNELIFRNGSFGELRIAKESNDLSDLAKVLPESYQKSNEFSVDRKCRQNVATDDRRTFTDKDKVHRTLKSTTFAVQHGILSLIVIRLRYWQMRTHCCGHSVVHDVSWGAQNGKRLLRTQNQKHFLCSGHKICVCNKCCARGQTVKHLCRQQCVGNNVSSFARDFRSSYVTSILITKLTFAMFLLKLSTLSAAIFLFISSVLSLLCV